MEFLTIRARALFFLVSLALDGSLLAQGSEANCLLNGHTSLSPAGGFWVDYPYTEDIAGPESEPIGQLTVSHDPELRWTKIQAGCGSVQEQNLFGSVPFHVLLRAQTTIVDDPAPTALVGSRYELQLRVAAEGSAPLIALWEFRRLRGHYPQTEHIGTTLQDLPPGNYAYSLWVRLLDPGEITFRYQWITAQGVPSIYPSRRSDRRGDYTVAAAWAPIGNAVHLTNAIPLDLSLRGGFQIVAGTAATALEVAFSIDGEAPPSRYGHVAVPDRLPDGIDAFDHRADLGPGSHTIHLWMRARGGAVTVRNPTTEYISFPAAQEPLIVGMREAAASDAVQVATEGSDPQPGLESLNDGCGRWTKVLEFETAPLDGDSSWMLEGFLAATGGSDAAQKAQIVIEVEHRESDAWTDMGVTSIQVTPANDGFYFFGDSTLWGDWETGNIIRLWVRELQCGESPGAGFTVTKRWLSVKLLPVSLESSSGVRARRS